MNDFAKVAMKTTAKLLDSLESKEDWFAPIGQTKASSEYVEAVQRLMLVTLLSEIRESLRRLEQSQ